MAQFSYETYTAQHRAKASNPSGGAQGTKVHFVNEWLKNDGDSVVVRFPYTSMQDIKFETTHTVTFPGDKFGKRVRCAGGDDCPLCKQGVKVDTRFFVKAIVYVTDPATGNVALTPSIWDRPAAFADIDLKNLMDEYGDLSDNLFKIKRNGSGTATRYTITVITNKTVYNPDVYKKDFTGLDEIDPVKVLTKSIDQYMNAINPKAAETDTAGIPTHNAAPVDDSFPVQETNTQPVPPVQQAPSTASIPVSATNTTPKAPDTSAPKRYTF